MERARQHHQSKLLSKAAAGWRHYHTQCHQNKVVSLLSFAQMISAVRCLNVVTVIFTDKEAAGKPFAKVEGVPEIL